MSRQAQHPSICAISAPLVLLVEDHAPTRDAITELIRRLRPSFRLAAVGDAEHAIEMCVVHAPNVIVMDINLPGMDGIEATRRVTQLCPSVRVVMHSGNDSAIFRERAAAAGAAAFVSKRFSWAELVPAISDLL